MWNFKFNDELKSEYLVNGAIINSDKINLKYNNKVINKIEIEGMVTSSAEKILQILKLMATKKLFFNINELEVGTDNIKVITLKNTSHTQFIFDVFTRYGIQTTSLNIGYIVEGSKLNVFINKKFNKNIEKLSPKMKQQSILYLLNIAAFIFNINTNFDYSINTLEYSEYNNTLNVMNSTNTFIIEDYIPTFKNIDNIEIKEIEDIENINSINYINTPYTGIASLIDNAPLGEYIICKNEENVKYLIFKYGVPESIGSYIIFNSLDDSVETNTLLTLDEVSENSFFQNISERTDAPYVLFHNTSECFPRGKKYEIIEENVKEFEKIISYFIKKNITEKIPLKTLENMFGKCFISNTIEIDRDTFMLQYKDDNYAMELLNSRLPYYDTFKLSVSNDFLKGILTGDIYSVLFKGASGTGKTTNVKVICDKIGLPLVSINLSLNCEESDIFGCMIPNPYKVNPEDPEFIWKDGPATIAIRKGYAISFEEINGGRPGVLMKLNSLLDETRQIELSSGEIVKAHPNCRIFATCNIGYEGTNRFNLALVNRFKVIKIFEEPDKDECFEIIKNRTGYANLTNMEAIWTVYLATKNYCKENNIEAIISVRQFLNIFKLGKYYKNAKEAYIDIILNSAFIEEDEHLHNFIDTILKAYDLDFKL